MENRRRDAAAHNTRERSASVHLPAVNKQSRGVRNHVRRRSTDTGLEELRAEESLSAVPRQAQREHVATSVRNYKQHQAAQHRQHATGISYLTDIPSRPEHGPHFTTFADAHLKPSPAAPGSIPAGGAVAGSAQDRAWSLGAFERQIPSGRKNVLELQAWLRGQMVTLSATSTVTGDQSADLFAYAEKMLDLYNMAFHELTRQVAVNCVERGRLMADIWTSQSELVSQILLDLKAKKDAHEAMSVALHRRSNIVDDACSQLKDKVLAQMQELKDLKQKVREQELRLQQESAKQMGVSAAILKGGAQPLAHS